MFDWDIPFDDMAARDALADRVADADLTPSERGAFAVVRVYNLVAVLGCLLAFVLSACVTAAAAILSALIGLPPGVAAIALVGVGVSAALNRASQALQQRWFRRLLRRRALVSANVTGVVPVALPAVREKLAP